uniref:Uncharacterized protein n=1 Tax=Haemonchus contortus TaxID=6289 RepID=W6NHZ9_HAECO
MMRSHHLSYNEIPSGKNHSLKACQPVPPPEKTGRGHDTAYVTIVTDQAYNPSKINLYLSYFPKTKIKLYARRLGDFSNLESTNIDGNFAFTFTIKHCVKQWVNQIVESSEHYISGNAVCVKPESPVMVETTTTARTTTRTTTTASSLIALEPAPPPAFVGRGHDTAYVTIVTDQPYNPSKANQYIGYFPKTKMEQHAWQLGDFSNLELTNVGGYSAFTFILKQCVCGYVKKWVNQIVQSSQHYTRGDAVCFYEESSSFVRERTTTTTASSSIRRKSIMKVFVIFTFSVYEAMKQYKEEDSIRDKPREGERLVSQDRTPKMIRLRVGRGLG